jgi:hypothetical protein
MSLTQFARRGARLLAVLTIPTLAGCSSLRYSSDWDRDVDHRSYVTFEFAPTPTEERTGPSASNTTFLDKRIKRAVTAALEEEKKGMRRVESGGGADLIVVYWLHLRDVVNVYSYGYYPSGASYSSYKEGTLVIDLVDRELDEVVWRGWAEGIRAEVRHSEDQIFGVVRSILRDFPPKK